MEFNTPITFGAKGIAASLVTIGFDLSEDTGSSWTVMQQCDLNISLPMPRQDVHLRLEASPFLASGKLAGQQLFIFLNGLFVGFHTFADFDAVTLPVLRNALTGRLNKLSLAIPTAVSPASLGLSSDLRQLGLAVNAITFQTELAS